MVLSRAGEADVASAAEQLGNRTPSVLATARRSEGPLLLGFFSVRGLEYQEPALQPKHSIELKFPRSLYGGMQQIKHAAPSSRSCTCKYGETMCRKNHRSLLRILKALQIQSFGFLCFQTLLPRPKTPTPLAYGTFP